MTFLPLAPRLDSNAFGLVVTTIRLFAIAPRDAILFPPVATKLLRCTSIGYIAFLKELPISSSVFRLTILD